MTSTSNILAGERRWASARRGGMTVLGKVAVPKPLNLPSQRLENHGLDPNVEIVPKGTLSWGGRSSSAASNPWGSSTLSPNADSSPGSSYLSAQPSSGGSGTRPSTAGSDKLHEPAANVWGPNSRLSSASGALTSSQTSSTSLRPRSAETRPGSSQLSRFTEPSSEISGAWGATGTTEKLGMLYSKNDDFSLSSGDFPTLSSGKGNSGKNIESQDYGSRPSSSSGIVGSAKVRSSTSRDVKSGASDSWRRDDQAHIKDGVHSGGDKWQGGPQQYLNANVPTQHFDAWHGPPINAPPGIWYTGPPAGPPYGAPVAPGGFPMEPFPYCRPQIPPSALANSQPVPPSGPGPRGHHPKNGDLFRPQIPDAFIRPNMPMRPGFYPAPVPYEGFYGPPMGYCHSNKSDIPFMGMPSGPHVYNRFPAPNGPDPVINHARAGGRGSMGKARASEQPESGHVDGNRAPYKVLLKQHNDWDGNVEEDNWEQSLPADASSLENNNQPRTTLRKFEWGADDESDNETPLTKTTAGEKFSGQTLDNTGGSTLESVPVESPERVCNSKGVDKSWAARSEMESTAFDEAPQALPSTSRDSTLIQKIEGLNAKARASDGRHDVLSTSSREEQKNRSDAHNVKAIGPAIEDGHATGNSGPTSGVSTGESIVHPPAASEMPVSRKAYHGGQGRGAHHGKGRYHSQDADGWRKRSPAAEPSGAVVANSELSSSDHSQDGPASVEVSVKSHIVFQGRDETESSIPVLDPSDSEAQRAKMRELAKQRAIQLQKEEEERTREQKAKALVKLEELNRRTLVGVGLGHKVEEITPSSAMNQEKKELPSLAEPVVDAANYEAPSSTLVSNCISVAQISEIIAPDVGESNSLSVYTFLDKPKNAEQEHLLPHGQNLRLKQNVSKGDAADCKAAPHINDVSAPRQKRMGDRQKQNASLDKNPIECQVHSTETAKIHTDVSYDTASAEVAARRVGSNGESSLPSNSSTTADSSSHQRKKNNRSGKNKHNMEDASLIGALSLTDTKGSHPAKPLTESVKSADAKLELDGGSIQLVADSKDTIQPSEQGSSWPSEEAHGRVNNQWKSQHSRRMPRNALANRLADKGFGNDAVIWAPVRSHNKVEAGDEGSQKTVPGVVVPTGKSDNVLLNNMKNKRAEMERYVPKPVAKEMAEQGSSQQPVASSYNQTAPDEAAGNADSGLQQSESSQPAGLATRSVGSSIELKNTDGKQNKQPRSHGPWRQRGLAESSHMQGLPHASSSSHPSKVVEKSLEQDKSMKPSVVMPETQPKCSDEGNTADGWNMPESYEAAAPIIPPAVKDRGLTGKGKKHPFKGQRNKDSNSDHDHKNANAGKIERDHIQSAPVVISQTDRIASKENRGPVERASHWQPKSQSYSGNNQQGSNFNGGQNCSSETSRGTQKDSLQDKVDFQSEPDKDSSETVTRPRQGPSVSESKHLAEKASSGHPDGRRERKAAPSRGRPYSPIEVPVYAVEPSQAGSADAHNQQHFPGFRKNGSQNNRSVQGHNSQIDRSSTGKDNRQLNTPANRERQRHNSHYEYQPVGPHNSSKLNHLEGSTDGLQNTGSRYGEKSQGHSRRGGGNSHGRQSGSARVDAGRG